jgi:menaquinone-dependent protoporphyrinogen oxidase
VTPIEEKPMQILIAYASRHGSTRGIAERIARQLRGHAFDVTLLPVAEAPAPAPFDAVVVGAAAYMGRWLGEATTYVRRHGDALAQRPVWLFSSGPVGSETVDAKGQDLLEVSRPAEFDELARTTHARECRVFYGAYDADQPAVGLLERLGAPFLRMPAIRKELPSGDFRDWPAIDAWADAIAAALTPVAATAGSATAS